ncbi:unnamed protein product [Linum trigynum]|uniref:Uncharacterized protein n=1 Tax=Linum trigynum TaxID=586398 RepID=A0AAV2DGU1_9ROSI
MDRSPKQQRSISSDEPTLFPDEVLERVLALLESPKDRTPSPRRSSPAGSPGSGASRSRGSPDSPTSTSSRTTRAPTSAPGSCSSPPSILSSRSSGSRE